MAKEIKKGAKKTKVAAVKKTKAAPTRRTRKEKSPNVVASIVCLALLLLGISLIFVAVTLKFTNDIDTKLMITCLGISLVFLIISAFVKKLNE